MITHSAFPCLYVFTKVQIMVGQQPATRIWTVCYLFVSVYAVCGAYSKDLHVPSYNYIGFFVLGTFYSVAVT